MTKKLMRSRDNRVFAGVLGGIGEYFDVDPVLIRLGYLMLTLFTGLFPGIIVYLIAILVVPEPPMAVVRHEASAPADAPQADVHDAGAV